MKGTDDGRWMLVVLGLSTIIVMFEGYGRYSANSVLLLQNCMLGCLEIVLLVMNAVGIQDEGKRQYKAAFKLARQSDYSFVALYLFVSAYGVTEFVRGKNLNVGGITIAWISVLAAFVNFICAQIVPTSSTNGKSAKLKFHTGAISALAAIPVGIAIHYLRWDVADPVATLLITVGVIWATVQRQRDQRREEKRIMQNEIRDNKIHVLSRNRA